MRYLLFCLLFLTNILVTNSQASDKDFIVNRLDGREVIKQNVKSITQDSQGFLWFGSENGLLRFDGHSIKSILHQPGNSNSIPSSHIHFVHSDAQGYLWVASQNGGLSLYNPGTEFFETFYPCQSDSADINEYRANFSSVTEDGKHFLWLTPTNGGGIYRFDKRNTSFTHFQLDMENWRQDTAALDILKVSDNEFWVGTNFSGIIVVDSNGNELKRFNDNANSPNALSSNSIQTMIDDGNGRIWIGMYSGGVNVYDKSTQTISKPDAFKNQTIGLFDNVYDFMMDGEQLLWIATDDGLVHFDTYSMEIRAHYINKPNNIRSLVNTRVRKIFKDRGGLFWVSAEHGGVHKLTQKYKFKHIGSIPEDSESLATSIVRSFLQFDENTLWVGSQNGGINVLDLKTLRVTDVIQHNPSNPNSLSNNGVTTFLRDPKGRGIWIGTWGGGLNLYDFETKQFRHFRHQPDNENTLADDRIQVLYQDKSGTFWIGTQIGLHIMDLDDFSITRVLNNPEQQPALSSNSVQSLAFIEDSDGILWIGTWNGLNRYDPNKQEVKHYYKNPNDPTSISSNHVISLYDDGNGTLWVGTFSGGLSRFDKTNETFKNYSQLDGLSSNVVFGILPDNEDTLWLSSNNGLSRFNPKTELFTNFNYEDGLIGDEFWWGAAYKSPDGKMYFGSTFGFTTFEPADIRQSNYIPPIAISAVRVLGQPIILPQDNKIELDYSDNYFTIEFAALDFTNPDRIQYAYKMEGLDRDWIYPKNRNFTSYSSLSGGNYTFRVKGTNQDGIWNEQGTSLSIYINPPLWQKRWFQIAGALLLIIGIIGFIQFRTRQVNLQNRNLENQVLQRTKDLALKQKELLKRNDELKEQTQKLLEQKKEIEKQKDTILEKSEELELKNKSLQELNQEKNSLIGIVAHDLRSPLSNVMGVIQIFKMTPEMTLDEQQELFQVLEKLVNKQLEMITRILDIEAIEAGKIRFNQDKADVVSITKRLTERYSVVAETKDITLHFKLPENPIHIIADANFLEQIFDNLISNAIKFSSSQTSVHISIQPNGKMLRWGITDEGPGISETDQKKLFGKFQRLSARPTGGESSTGLGLSIVKRFVEAMNGKVWCESKNGNGTTFWVEFPKHSA